MSQVKAGSCGQRVPRRIEVSLAEVCFAGGFRGADQVSGRWNIQVAKQQVLLIVVEIIEYFSLICRVKVDKGLDGCIKAFFIDRSLDMC